MTCCKFLNLKVYMIRFSTSPLHLSVIWLYGKTADKRRPIYSLKNELISYCTNIKAMSWTKNKNKSHIEAHSRPANRAKLLMLSPLKGYLPLVSTNSFLFLWANHHQWSGGKIRLFLNWNKLGCQNLSSPHCFYILLIEKLYIYHVKI